jgi:UDP-galactopyranose mutase
MVYTGPVDEYFDYRFGKLPYRCLEFKHETHNVAQLQPVAVVNYPNDYAYTRVTEFKHLTGQEHSKTSIVYEYPMAQGDPYYPIPKPENAELYRKYQALADATSGVHFVGRLATYRYYNMDQVVAQALTVFSHIAGVNRSEGLALKREPKITTVVFPATRKTSRRAARDGVHTRNGNGHTESVGNGNGNGHSRNGNGYGHASNGNGNGSTSSTALKAS